MTTRRVVLSTLLVVTALATAAAAGAQHKAPGEPARPPLGLGADTNDAQAYLDHGVSMLRRDPQRASAAFYWASRIDPGLPDALYARRIAYLLSQPQYLVAYLENSGKFADTPEMRRVDSLYYRAMTADPLFYRRFDAMLFRKYLEESVARNSRRYGASNEPSGPEIQYWIDVWLKDAGPGMRAWQAYGDGRFDLAVRDYREAIKRARKEERPNLQLDLARTYALTGNADSAVAYFGLVLADMRARDLKKTVRWYESKALIEQSVGMVYERAGRDSLAREAYGRALEEDLSYYPAHARLGAMALARGDTAGAVAELDLAVQVKQDDPSLRFLYAVSLVSGGRAAEANEQLRKAVALEPYYAAPYFLLARLNDAFDIPDLAKQYYADFLARAAARDPMLRHARERLKALGGG